MKIKVIHDKDYDNNLLIGNQYFRLNDYKLSLIDSKLESGEYEIKLERIK